MPPRMKSKVSKPKENLIPESESTLCNKVSKFGRRALADKTNSLSDNSNRAIEVTKKGNKVAKVTVVEKDGRPQRTRRLPTRYAENHGLLNNLTKNKDSVTSFPQSPKVQQSNISEKNEIPTKLRSKTKQLKKSVQQNNQPEKRKKNSNVLDNSNNDTLLQYSKSTESPMKSPISVERDVIRPKRIHRLPSRFVEHSMSPSKFLTISPNFASTPLQQKASKNVIKESRTHTKVGKSSNKSSPDTNNNPKKIRAAKQKVDFKKFFSPPQVELKSKRIVSKAVGVNRISNKSQSFKKLDDKQNKGNNNGVDVYEFTYDPDEEPPQRKKKKKRVVKKNQVKPKFTIFKNNYEQNLSRTLNSLKRVVAKKHTITTGAQKFVTSDAQINKLTEKPNNKQVQSNNTLTDNPVVRQNVEHNNLHTPLTVEYNKPGVNIIPRQQPTSVITESQKTKDLVPNISVGNTKSSDHENNFASIRIEDIAADFEYSDNYDDLNYSPVNSPIRPETSNDKLVAEDVNNHLEQRNEILVSSINTHDPLNLRDNISFFKEHPAASSSMNMSAKHPLASPWRVEFENLPIKWQVNTYVKPNMTPAVESSFISSKEDNKKKHVYTNMLPQSNEIPSRGIEENMTHLKQTSIISFMREVAEKSASKKKRAHSISPTKANALFDDSTNISLVKNKNNPQKIVQKDTIVLNQNKKSSEKENIRDNRKRKNEDNTEIMPAKSPFRQKAKDFSYFGFDESENQDTENISPKKIDQGVRALRPRARAVLQEINGQVGPTRANLPLAVKSKTITSSEAVDKMYENVKSAEVAPSFENINSIQKNSEVTTIDAMSDEENIDDADTNSVHLFEDLELIHHLKPTRKSYGKAKKVTFRQQSISDDDDDTRGSDRACHSDLSDTEDLGDLTFTMPVMNKKKPTRKKKTKSQLSNKEKKEADAWAAGFNSMCEDIEEFPLVME